MTDKNKDDKKPQWLKVGESTTSPVANKERKEILVDEYYVVVGFEVNNPAAFVDDVQDLGVHNEHGNGYGHAFYYVVKNDVVSKVMSFGPTLPNPERDDGPKVGWADKGSRIDTAPNKYNTWAFVKDGHKNSRPGTPDYGISELIKAFKIPLTLKQGVQLEQATEKMRQKIISGKQRYTVYMNDTCAATARGLLSDSGIDTPSGDGAVKHSGMINFPLAYAINPYMWHKNFTKSTYKQGAKAAVKEWLPKIGKDDQISFK